MKEFQPCASPHISSRHPQYPLFCIVFLFYFLYRQDFTAATLVPMFALLFLLPAVFHTALAETVYYNWDIGWVTAAPDGFARPVIGINGQWPCPQVDVTTGDRVVVSVYNGLGNQSTGLHWHGMRQHGTSNMDGSIGVAQCPIPPGGRMTYDFVVSTSFKIRVDK